MKYANGFDPDGEDDAYPLMALVEWMGEAAEDIERAIDSLEKPDLEETSTATLAYMDTLLRVPEVVELLGKLKAMHTDLSSPLPPSLARTLDAERERERGRDEALIFLKCPDCLHDAAGVRLSLCPKCGLDPYTAPEPVESYTYDVTDSDVAFFRNKNEN